MFKVKGRKHKHRLGEQTNELLSKEKKRRRRTHTYCTFTSNNSQQHYGRTPNIYNITIFQPTNNIYHRKTTALFPHIVKMSCVLNLKNKIKKDVLVSQGIQIVRKKNRSFYVWFSEVGEI